MSEQPLKNNLHRFWKLYIEEHLNYDIMCGFKVLCWLCGICV